MEKIKVLALQFDSIPGDVGGNVSRAIEQVRSFVDHTPVDLVVLPELFTCGYAGTDLSAFAEDSKDATFEAFRSLAEDLDLVIGWGFPHKSGSHQVYNSFAVIEPGRTPQIVHKTHLHRSQTDDRVNEPGFLMPGDRLGLVETRIGRLGVMICYDGCFVEVPRSLVLQGADCILWPARSGTYLTRTGLPRVRAIDNIVPIVLAEGAQTEADFALPAHSQILDHQGQLLCECTKREGTLFAEVDLAGACQCRQSGTNVWAQYRIRRPELYAALTGPAKP
jgi:predicted amidohydrolase